MVCTSNGHSLSELVTSKLKPAFGALTEAFEYAEDTASDPWEFAVAIRRFRKLGLSEADLRWLVQKGFVEHAKEVTKLADNGRVFLRTENLSFSKRTCFVLTSTGVSYARAIRGNNGNGVGAMEPQARKSASDSRKSAHAIPVWDSERRELRVQGALVKKFRWSAANQESVLAAFEEERWPAHIDDPLPPQPDQDPKRRLSDTIKCLNRKQQNALIHFRGDGTGEGVIWDPIDPTLEDSH